MSAEIQPRRDVIRAERRLLYNLTLGAICGVIVQRGKFSESDYAAVYETVPGADHDMVGTAGEQLADVGAIVPSHCEKAADVKGPQFPEHLVA